MILKLFILYKKIYSKNLSKKYIKHFIIMIFTLESNKYYYDFSQHCILHLLSFIVVEDR